MSDPNEIAALKSSFRGALGTAAALHVLEGQIEKPVRKRKEKPADGKVVVVTAFQDPMREMDKLHTLYDSLMDARKQHGEDVVPFHKFAALVKNQVTKLRDEGNAEVAFRVAVKDGKVAFTVRPKKEKESKE